MRKPVPGIVEPAITLDIVYAFQALAGGTASADQQRKIGDWLLTEACRIMQSPAIEVRQAGSINFHDDILIAEGRRLVGVFMREMLLPETLERATKLTTAMRPDAMSEHNAPPSRRPRKRP